MEMMLSSVFRGPHLLCSSPHMMMAEMGGGGIEANRITAQGEMTKCEFNLFELGESII